MVGLGGARGLSDELEHLGPGQLEITPVDGRLGAFTALLGRHDLFGSGMISPASQARTDSAASASGSGREQDEQTPGRERGPAPHDERSLTGWLTGSRWRDVSRPFPAVNGPDQTANPKNRRTVRRNEIPVNAGRGRGPTHPKVHPTPA